MPFPFQLLDLALGGVESLAADRVQRLTALPERDGLVHADLARLEPLDDPPQLGLGLLERELLARQRSISSTRLPKLPSASSTATRSPTESACAERITASWWRTMA